jgi:hypothetical protein
MIAKASGNNPKIRGINDESREILTKIRGILQAVPEEKRFFQIPKKCKKPVP